MKKNLQKQKGFVRQNFGQGGFTLIEILVVIGIIAILAVIVLIAINPGRQFAQSRNTQRTSNVNAILNAIGQNMADNKGVFNCPGATLTASSTVISSSGGINLRPCLVTTYINEIPVDPKTGTEWDQSASTYYTGYYVSYNASTTRVTISAPAAELNQEISITR